MNHSFISCVRDVPTFSVVYGFIVQDYPHQRPIIIDVAYPIQPSSTIFSPSVILWIPALRRVEQFHCRAFTSCLCICKMKSINNKHKPDFPFLITQKKFTTISLNSLFLPDWDGSSPALPPSQPASQTWTSIHLSLLSLSLPHLVSRCTSTPLTQPFQLFLNHDRTLNDLLRPFTSQSWKQTLPFLSTLFLPPQCVSAVTTQSSIYSDVWDDTETLPVITEFSDPAVSHPLTTIPVSDHSTTEIFVLAISSSNTNYG
jgi:hypothetical protein